MKLRLERQEPLHVVADAGAKEVFRQFYNETIRLIQGPLAPVAGDLSRWRENACRVALGLHAAENPEGTILTAETAERAVRLTRWAGRSTLRLLASGLEEQAKARAEKLRGWLLRAGGNLTLGALHKKHSMEAGEAKSLTSTFPMMFTMDDHAAAKGGPRTKSIRLAT